MLGGGGPYPLLAGCDGVKMERLDTPINIIQIRYFNTHISLPSS